MINKIIQGMCKALQQRFGDAYKVYTEKVEQDIKDSYFLITNVEHSIDAKLGGRYQNNNLFRVNYIPKPSHTNQEIYDVIDGLEDALEYITVDETMIHGIHMKSSITDDVLKFEVNYNFRTYKGSKEEERMTNLTYKGVI